MANILIVDDEKQIVLQLRQLLTDFGYSSKFITHPLKLFPLLENELFDLILVDINMPEMDGYEVCKRLKNSDKLKDIPVIFISALDDTFDKVKAFKCGGIDYITKPFQFEEVEARVATHLHIHECQIRIEQQNTRLEQQNRELQEAAKLRENLSNMIAHDIRSPLTAIIGIAEMIKTKSTDADILRYIDKIDSCGNRVNSFLDDMLMIAKMKGTKICLDLSHNDITLIVQEVHRDFIDLANAKGIVLTFNKPVVAIEMIPLDAILISRVLDNLITNALKYAPKDSTVSIQIKNLDSVNRSKNSDARVCIQVIDEGPGIPEENREQVFNLFESGKLLDKSSMSFGLGLTFCRLAIEAHGGRIFAEANSPQGTVITIEI